MTTAHGICRHCGKPAVHLAMGGVYQVVGDDGLDGRSVYADKEIEVEISIGTHTCFECGEIEDIWIEYPREVARLQARVEELEAIVADNENIMANYGDSVMEYVAENKKLKARVEELEDLLKDADAILDTLASLGIGDWILPGYKSGYAQIHLRIREALAAALDGAGKGASE